MIKRREFLIGAGIAGLGLARGAAAQGAYPSSPITIVVGVAPGGAGDMSARILAEAGKKRGAAVSVEFRPGAGGTLAAGQTARVKPDGTVLSHFSGSPLLTAPHLQSVPYDTLKDFTYVCSHVTISIPVYVQATSPFKTWQDMVAFARANPGKLRWGTAAVRGTAHIATEAAFKKEGLQTTFVPFNGGAAAMTALLGGHIEAVVSSDYGPQLAAGTVRLLAETGPTKISGHAALPTFAELGYPISVPSAYGLVGPAGLPAEVITFWEGAVKEMMTTPAYEDFLKLLGGTRFYEDSATMTRTVRNAYTVLGAAIEASGMRSK